MKRATLNNGRGDGHLVVKRRGLVEGSLRALAFRLEAWTAASAADFGAARTPFVTFGDRVRVKATLADGSPLFGVINQKGVQA